MAQVVGDGVANLSGQGKGVSLSALRPQPQNPSGPVDVIEFKKPDLVRTQSQAGQQHQDGMVATAHCGTAIDAGQRLPNLVGLNPSRYLWHRPVGNHGDGSNQLRARLTKIAGITEK